VRDGGVDRIVDAGDAMNRRWRPQLENPTRRWTNVRQMRVGGVPGT
jgi:hypothetical protein